MIRKNELTLKYRDVTMKKMKRFIFKKIQHCRRNAYMVKQEMNQFKL